jgi:hypothetical protein
MDTNKTQMDTNECCEVLYTFTNAGKLVANGQK